MSTIKVTQKIIKPLADQLGVDITVIPINTLTKGTKVEITEHGRHKRKELNLLHKNDLLSAMKIALSHLTENIYYYDYLEDMEHKFAKNEKKNIFK